MDTHNWVEGWWSFPKPQWPWATPGPKATMLRLAPNELCGVLMRLLRQYRSCGCRVEWIYQAPNAFGGFDVAVLVAEPSPRGA